MDITFFILLIVAIALGIRIGKDPNIVGEWFVKMILGIPSYFKFLVFFSIIGASFVFFLNISMEIAYDIVENDTATPAALANTLAFGGSIVAASLLSLVVGFFLYNINKYGLVEGVKKTFEEPDRKR